MGALSEWRNLLRGGAFRIATRDRHRKSRRHPRPYPGL